MYLQYCTLFLCDKTYILWIRLYAGTVPENKEYAAGTVTANKKYAAGTPKKFNF